MALRTVVQYPDPVLRAVSDPAPPDEELRALASDMLETMYAAKGRGLAAPQVGVTKRLFVMDPDWKDGTPDPVVCFNPVVEALGPDLVTNEERCLSIPDQPQPVTRPARIRLTWQDADGTEQARVLTGAAAVIAQHEADHLDGRLCIDFGDAEVSTND